MPFVVVSCVGFPPSASITQMSWKASEASVVNAIWVPSGDHAGQVSMSSGVGVSLVALLPSASITQMSQLPSFDGVQRANAICVPSAFQSARPSLRCGESVSRVNADVRGSRSHRSF